MPKCRVKLRHVIHFESESWITLGEGGYADMVTPQEAAEVDQEALREDPIAWFLMEESELPNGLDAFVEIVQVETL